MTTYQLPPHPICSVCRKIPDELLEYTIIAADLGMTPDAYVRAEEGTYNVDEDAFFCTKCYIDIGMPLNAERRACRHQQPTP